MNLQSSTPTFTTDRFSVANGALRVSDANNYWYGPAGQYFTSTSITVTVWFKAGGFMNWGRVFEFGDGNGNHLIGVYSYTSGQPTFCSYVNGAIDQNLSPPTTIALNTWYHMAWVNYENTITSKKY